MKLARFEGQPPQIPASLKIKSAQRLRHAHGHGYFAVRYIFERPRTTIIKTRGTIIPIPEFGAIAYNFEMHGWVAFEWNLNAIEKHDGIKARYRAEVWQTHDGKPTELAEIWFASEIPAGLSFVHLIFECIEAERTQTLTELRKTGPKPAKSLKRVSGCDEEAVVDHHKNVRDVCERLLRREYPQTYRAFDNKLQNDEIRKAFIADNIANVGEAPEAEGLQELLRDRRFVDLLSMALEKRGHKVPADEWVLACGWVKCGFYRMSEQELEQELNKVTGLHLKGSSWRRKADRLGLIRGRSLGRPENANLLPPLLKDGQS